MKAPSFYSTFQQKLKNYEARLEDPSSEQRINAMNSLSRALFVYDPDRSIQYAREARKLAAEIGYHQGIAESINNEALCNRLKSDFKKSKQLSLDALKIFETIGNKEGRADALNNIAFMEVNMEDYENALLHGTKALSLAQESGNQEIEGFSCMVNGMVYELLGDYPKAIDYHLKSLTLTRKAEDLANEGASLLNLGIVFRKIGEREKARDHFEQANLLFEELRIPLLLSSAQFNLGKIYSESGEFPKALTCLNKSLQIQKDIGHAQGQGACYITIGTVLQKMRKFSSAEENIRQSIELSRSFGKKNYECKGMLQLAECFLDQGNEQEAINLLEEAYNEAEINGIKEIRYQLLNALSRAYEAKGDFKRAFSFYKKATALRDEMINEESMIKNKGLMLLHEVETARHERQIAVGDKERAEQSEKFKEQFLANMSHEIRTPMNAIAGLADLLDSTTLNALQSKYVHAIRHSADNLLSIIQDILDFSKIESGETVLEVINFSIRECIETLFNTLRYKAEEKSIKLHYWCDALIPQVVGGDPVRLKQILINLVGNAIKFTEHGTVSIHAELQNQSKDRYQLKFKVIDTGIGIAEDKLQDIFRSFVQASSSTARKYGGTGLGLSITKHLVEIQGGEISVESIPGEGTTFQFFLPYQHAKDEEKVETPSLNGDTGLKGIRILLVEDNKFNQMVAVDALQLLIPEVKIEIAENGKKALEKLEQQTFNVILLDLQMPEMDGYETAEHIQKHDEVRIKNIPIIALTANATKTEKEKCLNAGMHGYISKPFRMDALLRQIQLVLTISAPSS